jgi:protein TonB
VVCPDSENNVTDLPHRRSADPPFSACLVEGDAAQRALQHRLRRRSVLISITLQIAALAALILAPIFSKTERIAMANTWVPMPPYRPHVPVEHLTRQPHPVDPVHRLHFCLSCSPELPPERPAAHSTNSGKNDLGPEFVESNGPTSPCIECGGLRANTNPQPLPPPVATPKRVVIGHLDPATLIHRIEPAYPTLPRQTHREGTVELHAIIATDGSVRSLQFLTGDAMFVQSAMEAVSQWRYKPTYLNGVPVEVDTHITVIYRLNH